jgi:hypothetical protein
MKRLPVIVVVGLVLVALAVPMSGGEIGFGGSGANPAPSVAIAPGAAASPSGGTSASEAPAAEPPDPTPAATPDPTATPVALAEVPIVPVTRFRAAVSSTSAKEVAAVLAGTSKRYDTLELVEADADAILAALEQERPEDEDRLVLAKDAAALAKHLAKDRKRLGFLRADEVTPAVRALAWGKRSLFGVGRVTAAGDWPLTAQMPVAEAGADFDPAATWTLFAGGDILLDRGVAQTLKVKGKGADFPFDGGTAEITSRYCCSSFGWRLPRAQRTGDKGAMRDLIKGADLAIANFENPAPNRFRYHTSGTVFSADPALLKGLSNAGIDWVSLANNHIGDAGRNGIIQTIRNLKKEGIASGGAGKNKTAARKPTILEAGGQKVALLGYDTIARVYNADADTPGSARLTKPAVKADVKKAREAGADVVIVFPHWGTEYDPTPFPRQRELAKTAIDAGADMVIGNHAHWAAAMEVYEGKPIWYALGNFIFDQTWSELTMEGMTLELTFHGPELVQARMRPHIILDKAQPNLLDPAADGRVVMGQVFDASKGLLPW